MQRRATITYHIGLSPLCLFELLLKLCRCSPGSVNTKEVWEEGHQSLKSQLCQDGKMWGGPGEHYPIPCYVWRMWPMFACIYTSGEEMLSLWYYKKQKRRHKKTWIFVLALGSLAAWHWASHFTSLRLHFFAVKTRPGPVLRGLLEEHGESLTHCAMQTGFPCRKARKVPPQEGHLPREYAAERPRAVARGWRTGLWGTRESLEDKRTGQGVSSQGVSRGFGHGTVEAPGVGPGERLASSPLSVADLSS